MDKVVSDVVKELQSAIETHSLFTSAHQAYAIILEELDELWDEIKKKKSMRDVKNMRAEAVQVAAMAMKFIMSMENGWDSEPKIVSENPYKGAEAELKKIEAKCSQCLYDFVTKEMRDELGLDPCDTCGDDNGNWKPKEEVINPKWMVCETCDNSSGNENCDHCKDNDRTSRPTRWVPKSNVGGNNNV